MVETALNPLLEESSTFFELTKPWTIAKCAHVTVTPDDNRIIVFNNGSIHGFIGRIPNGGQTQPIQIVGDTLEWKKAQKKPKKNIISETMNKTNPIRRPRCTAVVWQPSNVASRTISQNQLVIANKKVGNPVIAIATKNKHCKFNQLCIQ